MKSTVEQLTRQVHMVNRLRKTPGYVPRDVLLDNIARRCELSGISFPVELDSQLRMLQRDIKDIEKLFDIHIAGRRGAGYRIADEFHGKVDFDRFVADFDLMTAMSPDAQLHKFVLPEKNRYVGSDNIFPLLHAIKQSRMVEFSYYNVRKGSVKRHTVAPYFLKEDQMRWYLVSKNTKGKITLFSLSHIDKIEILDDTFKRDDSIDGATLFEHCYGIWDDADTPVETVVLSYDPLDGAFLKNVPLHHSQEILVDNDEEFRISLKIKITNDFIMALLARSRSLEVIEQLHLRERVYNIYAQALNKNKIKI